jgi:hypothetical protein
VKTSRVPDAAINQAVVLHPDSSTEQFLRFARVSLRTFFPRAFVTLSRAVREHDLLHA